MNYTYFVIMWISAFHKHEILRWLTTNSSVIHCIFCCKITGFSCSILREVTKTKIIWLERCTLSGECGCLMKTWELTLCVFCGELFPGSDSDLEVPGLSISWERKLFFTSCVFLAFIKTYVLLKMWNTMPMAGWVIRRSQGQGQNNDII